MSNEKQGMEQATNRRKVVEVQTIDVGDESMVEACEENPTVKVVICTGNKFYRPPLPSTYKGKEIFDSLNDGMEWVFRDYGRSLKQEKYPLPPRDYVVGVYVHTNSKELEKSLKLQGCIRDLQYKVR